MGTFFRGRLSKNFDTIITRMYTEIDTKTIFTWKRWMKEIIIYNLNIHVEEWISRCQLIAETKHTILKNKLVSFEKKIPTFDSKMLLLEKKILYQQRNNSRSSTPNLSILNYILKRLNNGLEILSYYSKIRKSTKNIQDKE